MPIESNNKIEFSLKEIETAALFAELAYHEEESEQFSQTIQEAQKYTTIEKIAPFYKENPSEPELAGYAVRTDNQIIVTFAGTKSVDDVKSDINFIPQAVDLGDGVMGHVHGGILEQFDKTKPSLEKAIKQVEGDKKHSKIFCTGHSLGGALSVVFTNNSINANPSIEHKTVTFGAPPAFSRESAKHMLKRKTPDSILNIQQKYDPVPKVPELLGYKVVGKVITLPVNYTNPHSLEEGYSKNYYTDLHKLKPTAEAPNYTASGYMAAIAANSVFIATRLAKGRIGAGIIAGLTTATVAVEGMNKLSPVISNKVMAPKIGH